MREIVEKELKFQFDIDAFKYDDTYYYRRKFQGLDERIKAVDILAVKENTGYLIEVKDYRLADTKFVKYQELIPKIVFKVLCTLAGLIPMKINSNDDFENIVLNKFMVINSFNIICHIELPEKNTKLQMAYFNLSNFEIKMKQKLKNLCQEFKVVNKNNLRGLPWRVI